MKQHTSKVGALCALAVVLDMFVRYCIYYNSKMKSKAQGDIYLDK